MRLGILKTGHALDQIKRELGDYDSMFQRLLGPERYTYHTFNVVDDHFPPNHDVCDAWLITGSRHAAYDRYDWVARLMRLICDINDAKKPLVGICFGHQIIAQALGGKVEKYSGGWAVGRNVYEIDGARLALNAWHQDQVVKRPENACVIGTNAFCENAALAYDRHILTFQAHPEFENAMIAGLIAYSGKGVVPDNLLQAAEDCLDKPIDNAAIAAKINAFLEGA